MTKTSDPLYDVAIIGAGVAGLYCAWRLLNENKPKERPRLIVLEKLPRIGGRLRTGHIKISDQKIVVEEGGMRFLKGHHRLQKLLSEVGLEDQITPFGMGDENNLFSIRGELFSRDEAQINNHEKWAKVYNLEKSERNKSPFQIVQEILSKITAPYQDLGKWEPNDFFSWVRLRQLEFPKGSGLKVYQWGFRALMEELGLSNECTQMLIDTGGFSTPFDDMVSAGSGLQLIASFPEEPEFFTLDNGFEGVPRALSERVRRRGGEVETGCQVEHVERSGKHLTVVTASHFKPAIRAKKVIIALPARPMRQVLKVGKNIDHVRTAHRHLDQIVHMPLTKINLYFETRWWKKHLKILGGGCFTDMSLAQVYFFELNTADPNRKFSALTIYSDGRRSNFWRQLQSLGTEYQHPTMGHEVKSGTDLSVCSVFVVRHAVDQLKRMFDLDDKIPMPLYATISMWGGNEIGEGDHQWAIGANDQEIRNMLAKVDDDVHLCGEAISDYQDWVEGGLRSADHALQRGFNMPPYIT